MSENTQPEPNPNDPGKQSEAPPGYDQPVNPAYGAPSYQPPAAPENPYGGAPYPGAPQANPYQGGQTGYPQPGVQQGYPQQNMQQGYPQPGVQQPYQQGYQQPGYGYGYAGVEQKSKIVAGILGILLGSLGVHRFYLGETKMGIIQLVVTFVTFGVGGIWGFIEGIMILVGADPFKTDARGIPLKD